VDPEGQELFVKFLAALLKVEPFGGVEWLVLVTVVEGTQQMLDVINNLVAVRNSQATLHVLEGWTTVSL